MLLLLVRILALVMRHANRTFQRPFILVSVACLAVQIFYKLSNKRKDFQEKKKKKVIEHKIVCLDSLYDFLLKYCSF